MKDDLHHISKVGDYGIVAVVLIGLAMLIAWIVSHETFSTSQSGGSVDRRPTRCSVYRLCCRPRCRYVGVDQWLL